MEHLTAFFHPSGPSRGESSVAEIDMVARGATEPLLPHAAPDWAERGAPDAAGTRTLLPNLPTLESHTGASYTAAADIEAGAGEIPRFEPIAAASSHWRACFPTAKHAAQNAFLGALLVFAGALGHAGYAHWRRLSAPLAEKSFYDIEPRLQPYFDAVMAKARTSARVRALEAQIEAGGGTVDLDYRQGDGTDKTLESAARTATITWDPEAQIIFRHLHDTNATALCATNSPALNLLHSLRHARNSLKNPLAVVVKSMVPLPLHDNVEEFDVIHNVINPIAEEFGEPVRDSHHATMRRVSDVFDHENVACSAPDVESTIDSLRLLRYDKATERNFRGEALTIMNKLRPWLMNARVDKADIASLRRLVVQDNFELQTAVAGNTTAGVFPDSLIDQIRHHAGEVIALTDRLPYFEAPPIYSIRDELHFLNPPVPAVATKA